MAFLANDQIDVPDVRSSLEKLWVRNEQRYQQALAQVDILPENPLLIFYSVDCLNPTVWSSNLCQRTSRM